MTDPTLVLLPGLGADARLFEPQRARFPALIVPEWLQPAKNESLESFAARMADRIPRTRPLILGGVSLGGMVAAQLAPLVMPDALLLIGTCLHPREISRAARAAASAAPWLTSGAIDRMRRLAPVVIRALGPMTSAQRESLLKMADAVPAAFLRWAGPAIFAWHGAPPSPCPVFRIHGDRDRVIPPPASGVDLMIHRGGHIPSFTNPAPVNQAIAELMARVTSTRT